MSELKEVGLVEVPNLESFSGTLMKESSDRSRAHKRTVTATKAKNKIKLVVVMDGEESEPKEYFLSESPSVETGSLKTTKKSPTVASGVELTQIITFKQARGGEDVKLWAQDEVSAQEWIKVIQGMLSKIVQEQDDAAANKKCLLM